MEFICLLRNSLLFLLLVIGLAGCGGGGQPDEEQLVTGLGLALSEETEDIDLISEAQECACGPTCLIALKQHLRGEIVVRYGWEIGGALADGALAALPLADKTKDAIERVLETVDTSVALGLRGEFERDIEWEQNPSFEIGKTCSVQWYGVYDPSSNKLRVVAECECSRSRGSPCVFEYSYKVSEDGARKGRAVKKYR